MYNLFYYFGATKPKQFLHMKDNLFHLQECVSMTMFSVCMHMLAICVYITCSKKVSSKQNTLMKWFSKSPKKESSQLEQGKPRDAEEKLEESPASKKRKVET